MWSPLGNIKNHYSLKNLGNIVRLEYAEMYRMEEMVLQSLMGSNLQRAEVRKGLNLFRCGVEKQVLINRVIRAPEDDTIERVEDAKQEMRS